MNHLSFLRNNKHSNKHLQRAWNKYGEDCFDLQLVEQVPVDQLEFHEQKWIDAKDSWHKHNGYNASPVAGIARGFTFSHTEKAKASISAMRKGIKFSEQHIINLSISHMGQKPSAKAIENARLANTGKKRSEETKNKIKAKREQSIEKAAKTVRKKSGRSASGYKGVYSKRDSWQAKININGRDVSVGTFETKEEAAKNYDYHIIQQHGKSCFLNFPDFDYSVFKPKMMVPGTKKSGNKLNPEKAKMIRQLYAGGTSVTNLAQTFGVSDTAIRNVVNNVTFVELDTAQVTVVYNPL